MLSIYTLAVLATAALVSASDGKSSAAPTLTFSVSLSLPAGSSLDDWYPTTTPTPTPSPTSYTSTLYTTTTYTVTSCAPTVTSCPVGAVTTVTITSTTVICPATSSTPPPPPPPTTTCTTTPVPVTTAKVYPTTSSLLTTYTAPVYSANTTIPSVKPSSTLPAKPSAFTGAANMVGGSLSLAAVVAFAVAAL